MATQNQINNINMSRVLRAIWLNRGCSRADMCRDLGLNKSTVTKNVQILLDRGVAEELKEGDSTPIGGRRPMALGIRQDFCYIMGIEIQTEAYSAVICNARGQIVFTRTNRLRNPEGALLEQLRHALDELHPFIEEFRIAGISLGLSGVIDTKKGIICRSLPFGIRSPYPLAGEASRMAGVPVLIENDANCCCWGDLAGQKSLREENSLFLLSEFRDVDVHSPGRQSLAIGLGLILGGLVHHGKDFSAGEFTSVLREGGGPGQFSFPPDVLGQNWGDPDTVLPVIDEISRNIAYLVNVLNLSRVVIGGVLEQYPVQMREALAGRINAYWPYENTVACQIEFSEYGDYTVAYGAAGYFLEQLFGLPDVESPDGRGWQFLQNLSG